MDFVGKLNLRSLISLTLLTLQKTKLCFDYENVICKTSYSTLSMKVLQAFLKLPATSKFPIKKLLRKNVCYCFLLWCQHVPFLLAASALSETIIMETMSLYGDAMVETTPSGIFLVAIPLVAWLMANFRRNYQTLARAMVAVSR